MFTQLASPLPVLVVDKGKGTALAVIDYGPEHNLIWVTALDESGEIWCAPNHKVRLRENWTMGRPAAGPSGWQTAVTGEHETRSRPRFQGISIPGADAEHAAFP